MSVVGPLPDYFERACTLPFERVDLPSPHRSPTRLLSQVERATIRVSAPDVEDVPPGNSVMHEATLRLAIFKERDLLEYFSGAYIAATLQRLFWGAHPSIHAHRGWALLAELDRRDLVEVWLSAEPIDLDLRDHFRRMRLRERLRELDGGITKSTR